MFFRVILVVIAIDAFTSQAAIKKCSYSSIGISGCAGNDPDPGFLQRGHRAGSKAAADKHIDTISSQNHSQRLMRVTVKTRHSQFEQPATVYPEENGFARVVFDAPQRAVTPGQAVVLYDGDMVVGGGTITEALSE